MRSLKGATCCTIQTLTSRTLSECGSLKRIRFCYHRLLSCSLAGCAKPTVSHVSVPPFFTNRLELHAYSNNRSVQGHIKEKTVLVIVDIQIAVATHQSDPLADIHSDAAKELIGEL